MGRPKKQTAEIVQLITEPSNGAAEVISYEEPYTVTVVIEGVSDLMFHAWNPEAVDEKAAIKKGSAGKKIDNIESYVYRNEKGELCIPGEYLRMSIINAAKFRQDPRSPRKSAMDLYKAAVVPLTLLAPILAAGKSVPATKWDYLDKRRVMVQRNGINRTRPCFKQAWRSEIMLQCNLPEYVSRADLLTMIGMAGRLIGVGNYRPTFGRFGVVNFA